MFPASFRIILAKQFPCHILVHFTHLLHCQTIASAQLCGGVRGKLNAVRAERMIAGSERERERKERILQAALNVGAPIAVMRATIISTRCERLNITTRIHAEHLHPTSGFCLGKLYSRSTLGNQLRRRRAMKFKPTPAKAHAGVALFFLRRLKGKEKFLFCPSGNLQVYSATTGLFLSPS
jgi:hypothetical protein